MRCCGRCKEARILLTRIIAATLLLTATSLAQDTVRIEVFGLFHPRQLQVEPAPGTAAVLTSCGKKVVLHGRASQASIVETAGELRVRVADQEFRGQEVRISARDGSAAEIVLSVPGKIRRHYRGIVEVRAGSEGLQPIVLMDLEIAVASVIAAESPPNAPIEALKAQAIVTRSYFVSSKSRHAGFDFCDTTHCQFLREPPPVGSPAARATDATRGLVLTWRDQPFAAMFSASCSGRTRTLAEAGLPVRDYPYYPMDCAFCRRHPDRWQSHVSSADAPALPSHPTEASRLKSARILGWQTVPGSAYRITSDGDELILEGAGKGHGIGLCQRGAAAMAEAGANFQTILKHYYPNTTVQPRNGPR